jgi:hypothetical protein
MSIIKPKRFNDEQARRIAGFGDGITFARNYTIDGGGPG